MSDEVELTSEEINKYRKLVQKHDQEQKGIDIVYTRTGPDGFSLQAKIYGATPEQAAIVTWLQAEDEWKRNSQRRAREIKLELERQRKRQEAIDRRAKQVEDHEAALTAPDMTGFRRDMLLRHAPTPPYEAHDNQLRCRVCYDTDYEPERLVFPCNEYVFTMAWVPDSDEYERDGD
jgi:hypothetical protein